MAPLSSSAPCLLKPSDQSLCLQEQPPRRSANYAPTLWTDHEIQSLASKTIKEEEEKEIAGRLIILKEHVKQLLQTKKEADQQLQLIDDLQQLGVAYHFKDDIKSALSALSAPTLEDAYMELSDNLHATALLFRLLREYGFSISEDVFIKFKDEEGLFRASLLGHADGLLSLYEACYLAKEGEEVMDQALAFATQHLKSLTTGSTSSSLEPYWREQVAHALELPRAWRMERLHARWFIETSQRHTTVNPLLLEFARLDFNRIQRIYHEELSHLSRWWTNLGLVDKLPFCRDRLMECYFFLVGCQFEPQFRTLREALTKQNCLTTIIDDVYGTLNELQLFTDAIDRWDVTAIEKLPNYMKIVFLAIFNYLNDIGFEVLRDKELDVIPHLKRAWGDQCKAYLIEAKWFHSGYKPKLGEYLENAFISITVPLYITLAYCTSEDLSKEHLELLYNTSCYPIIVRGSSLIFRLLDDALQVYETELTSSDELQRGDVPKSIQCYMLENDATEDVAREHIRGMIYECWREINGDRDFTCCFHENLNRLAINAQQIAHTCCFHENLNRLAINAQQIAHCMYGSKDNFGKPSQSFKQIITSIMFDPIVF